MVCMAGLTSAVYISSHDILIIYIVCDLRRMKKEISHYICVLIGMCPMFIVYCMCCAYVCICVCTHACVCVLCVHACACTCAHVCMCVYVCTYVYVHVHACVYT